MIKNTQVAAQRSGMPHNHAQAFQRVANKLNCVIGCRAVGEYATGLILENYASKGYHVKTKSCNWGPMAGFVLADPRFSKKGLHGVESQRKATHDAIHCGAGEIQVYLTDNRRMELEQKGWMTRSGGDTNSMKYSARNMKFVLERKSVNVPGATGKQMWAVYYDKKETAMPSSPLGQKKSTNGLLPVMALVDPLCDPIVRGSYRSAMTGDYDLWGIWPAAKNYDPKGADKRAVPNSEKHAHTYDTFKKHEHPDLGNITARCNQIKLELNTEIKATGYTGGNMVHHSDETGRPQVFEVEMDFIVFIPKQDGKARFVTSMFEYRKLLAQCVKDYSISLNGSWGRTLGFSMSKGGNYEC